MLGKKIVILIIIVEKEEEAEGEEGQEREGGRGQTTFLRCLIFARHSIKLLTYIDSFTRMITMAVY